MECKAKNIYTKSEPKNIVRETMNFGSTTLTKPIKKYLVRLLPKTITNFVAKFCLFYYIFIFTYNFK